MRGPVVGTALRTMIAALALVVAGVGLPTTLSDAASPAQGGLYILQGWPGQNVDFRVDSGLVAGNVAPKAVVGPLSLNAGKHQLSVSKTGSSTVMLNSDLTVAAAANVDAVVHEDAQASPQPRLTVFPNDLSTVNAGKVRLAIAHTAAVPAADIRVDGKVLFSNVANGEGLTTIVPAGSYQVDIVPTGTNGPAVLGPAAFDLSAGTLTRVFAIGNPSLGNMEAIVQVLPVSTSLSGPPTAVDTGSGGRAGSVGAPTSRDYSLLTLGLVLMLIAAVARGRVSRPEHRRP